MDLAELRLRCKAGESFRYLLFWGHQVAKDGRITASCLSQWYPAAFQIDGIGYPTAEHWMMASKARLFGDNETLAQILGSPDPKAAKALGRTVRNFEGGVWDAQARRLVAEGNLAKFGQNAELRTWLLATEEQVLVEASPFDRIWGIGLAATDPRAAHPETWDGQNLLGFALMDVRAELAAQNG